MERGRIRRLKYSRKSCQITLVLVRHLDLSYQKIYFTYLNLGLQNEVFIDVQEDSQCKIMPIAGGDVGNVKTTLKKRFDFINNWGILALSSDQCW